MSLSERIVLATFCDDIRYEVGNKHSLMGCYKQELFVDHLPATLPKLCASVSVNTPIDRPFEKLTICARLDGDSLADLEIEENQLKSAQSEVSIKALEGMKRIEISCHLTFAPFIITEEGVLRIEIVTEDGVIKGSVLQIRMRSQEVRAAI